MSLKKLMLICMLVGIMAFSATAGNVGSNVDLNFLGRIYYDNFSASGSVDKDKVTTDYLYLILKGQINDKASVNVIIDAADLDKLNTGGNDGVEVATINYMVNDMYSFSVGKQEMAFGQNVDNFIVHNWTWGVNGATFLQKGNTAGASNPNIMFEEDKQWGINNIFKIENFGKFEVSVYEKGTNTADDGLFDNYTARLTADKLMDGLTVSLSYDVEGYSVDDQKKFSLGAKYKASDLTVYSEYLDVSDANGTANNDLNVLQIGLCYAMDKTTLKAEYNTLDMDMSNDSPKNLLLGLDYALDKNLKLQAEYVSCDTDHTGEDKGSNVRVGLEAKF